MIVIAKEYLFWRYKMAKKLGKILAVAAIASAAAGAYYYYKSKTEPSDYDDFDDFESEDDSSLDDYLKEEAYQSEQTERSLKDIFPINLSSDTVNEARETLKKAVLDIGEKVADVAGSVTGVVKSNASDANVEDFKFYDLSKDEEAVPHSDDTPIDIINTGKHAEEAPAAEETPAETPAAEAPAQEEEPEKSAGEILFTAEPEAAESAAPETPAESTDSAATEEFKFDE